MLQTNTRKMFRENFTSTTNSSIAICAAKPHRPISRGTNDGGHSYVYKQPENPEEEARCKEALEGCPVEAIGNDGA
jgi:hypothetical protein